MTGVSRRELLRRASALAAGFLLIRLQWLDKALGAGPSVVQQTMKALVEFVVPDAKDGELVFSRAGAREPASV